MMMKHTLGLTDIAVTVPPPSSSLPPDNQIETNVY
jgi:hypothetical protein